MKKAANIVETVKRGNTQLSGKPLKKSLRQAQRLLEKDAFWEEYMGSITPHAVGGEYVMPVESALDLLTEIYGDGPSLDSIDYSDDDEDTMTDGEFERLQNLRKKRNPSKPWGAWKPKISVGLVPGVSKYIGSMPREVLQSKPGLHSTFGGSSTDDYQNVWLSGASASYDFEVEDNNIPPGFFAG